MVFADLRTRSFFAVGEAFMPPAYTVRFRLTVRKNGTFLRREASMPPLQCFCNVPKTARQTPIYREDA